MIDSAAVQLIKHVGESDEAHKLGDMFIERFEPSAALATAVAQLLAQARYEGRLVERAHIADRLSAKADELMEFEAHISAHALRVASLTVKAGLM